MMPVQPSLSLTSRWLTRAIAVAYLLLGLIMFAVPGWSAHHFPWKVSPFVAMTIGSYLLGSAWIAGIVQHTWTFARVYTLLLYLWLFGALETVMVIIHGDKLAAGAALTAPYLITLGLTVVAALAVLADWWSRRPPLTSFTLDALGVFYLSLSLSVLFMIGQRGMATLVTYLRGAIGLVIIIVIATLLNIGIFQFSAHPRHIVYLATYLVVMIGTVGILWWDHRETSGAARPAGLPAPIPSWPAPAVPAGPSAHCVVAGVGRCAPTRRFQGSTVVVTTCCVSSHGSWARRRWISASLGASAISRTRMRPCSLPASGPANRMRPSPASVFMNAAWLLAPGCSKASFPSVQAGPALRVTA